MNNKMTKEQLNKILLSPNASDLILKNLLEIEEIIPELKQMENFNQNNHYHIYDVLTHSLEVVRNTKCDLILRLSALLHDIGKPSTYTTDAKGTGHFYGHAKVSVSITKNILRRLGYDGDIINDVLLLIEYHDYPIIVSEKPLRKLLKRFASRLLDKLFLLKRADILGQNPEYRSRLSLIDEAQEMISKLNM